MSDQERRINSVYEINQEGIPQMLDAGDLRSITDPQTRSFVEKAVGFMLDATVGKVGAALKAVDAGISGTFIKGQLVVVSVGYSYALYLRLTPLKPAETLRLWWCDFLRKGTLLIW